MKKLLIFSMLVFALVCSVGYAFERGECQSSLDGFYRADPGVSAFVGGAYGYAIFPTVGEGAFIVGGGGGKRCVYQGGRMFGISKIGFATIGAQIGGQGYKELIVFQDARAFRNFTDGNLKVDAGAAIVLVEGVGAKAAYHDGVWVGIRRPKGLMAKAAVGMQGFSYHPVGSGDE
jgi:hypothetical protein